MDPSRASGTSPATTTTPSSTLSNTVGAGTGPNSAEASASAAVSPPRPQSGAAATAPHADAPHPAGDGNADEAKRPRACEACRGLKVRCEMADEGPCRRCKKAGRRCVVTVRSRGGERQKKTDTRVAELEKKIDILAATLQARGASEHAGASGGGHAQRPGAGLSAAASPEASRAPNPMISSLLTHWGVTEGTGSPNQPATEQKRKLSDTQDARTGDQPAKLPRLRGSSLGEDYVDIVDSGLITPERAESLLDRYNKLMAPHFPAVVFPPDETAANIRVSKPLLFLAIMAASTSDSGALQKTLVKELMRIFAEKVIIGGEKSLELVQALFISVTWYWPPESFDELKFYQLAHIGIILAIDIGLGRSGGGARPRSHQIPPWGISSSRGPNRIDAESLECRRTWLAGYLLSTNTAIGLRRTNLLAWSSFMQESLEVLEASKDAAPTDKYFCQLVRANRLGEEVMMQFSLDEPVMSVNLSDVRTQLTLKGFEKQLEKLKRDVPKELHQPALVIGWGTMDIFMHEMSLHSDDFYNMKGCFPTTRLDDGLANMTTPTTAQLDAVLASFGAVTGIFECFLDMDLESVRSLPVFNLVRVAYSIVVLIKIYFTATAPDSELGKILPKEAIKVDHYLDAMTSKFMAAAAEDKCRPAAKFLIVIVMLRGWLNNKTSEKERRLRAGSSENPNPAAPSPESRAARGDSVPVASRTSGNPVDLPNTREKTSQELSGSRPSSLSSGAMQQPGISSYPVTTTANTPLQLLSEVATGDPTVGGRPMGWQATPGGGGGGGNPFFLANSAAGMAPMDMTAGSMVPQWTEAASGMGYFLGDTVDWEGMAMSLGAGMSSEQEYEIMNMVTELNKPWGGDGMGQVPSGQGVYYQQ